MPKVFHTSNSKAGVWLRCRYAYWLRYVDKLRRRRIARPLQFGRMVHEMVEARNDGKDPFKILKLIAKRDDKMFRSQREEYGDLVNDVRVIMTEYFEHWATADKTRKLEYLRLKGKTSEHSFEVEVSDGIVAVGKIDNLATTQNARMRWLVERKSGGRMLSEDHRWRNNQSALYIRIIELLGLPPLDGTVWDFIRSKSPSRPQVKKNGELSARALDTLPLAIIEAFKEEGFDPASKKYAPLIKLAKANRSTYFERVFNPAKKGVIDALFNSFVNVSREMADLHGKRSAMTMNVGRHCDWCDFEPICRARLQGNDVEFVISKEYVEAPKFEREEPDFEA